MRTPCRQLEVRRHPSTPWPQDRGLWRRPPSRQCLVAFPVPKRILQNPADGAHPVGQGTRTDAHLPGAGPAVPEVRVLTKGKQGRHLWVTMFTAFCLYDRVDHAIMVFPQIT